MAPMLDTGLTQSVLFRKIKRDVAYAPQNHQELGITNLCTRQGVINFNKILEYMRGKTITKKSIWQTTITLLQIQWLWISSNTNLYFQHVGIYVDTPNKYTQYPKLLKNIYNVADS